MFGISFSELLLIALVALLVLGPERLPGAARTAGLWVGRLKRSFNAIRQEVERELGADEIRRQLHNEQILALEREIKQSIQPPGSVAPAPSESSPQVLASALHPEPKADALAPPTEQSVPFAVIDPAGASSPQAVAATLSPTPADVLPAASPGAPATPHDDPRAPSP